MFVFRESVKRLRIVQTITIESKFPWIEEAGETHYAINHISGRKRLLRASPSFYTKEPQYDFVEFWNGSQKTMGQLRLLFEQPFEDRSRFSGPYLALVRLLAPTNSNANEDEVEDDAYWSVKCRNLLENNGCAYLRWKLTSAADGDCMHVVVGIYSIIRPVHIVPDFYFPLELEKGSKHWHEVTAQDVSKDVKRYQKEEVERWKKIDKLRERGVVDPSVSHPRLPRRKSDGPAEIPDISDHRFFHNKFFPWTAPEL